MLLESFWKKIGLPKGKKDILWSLQIKSYHDLEPKFTNQFHLDLVIESLVFLYSQKKKEKKDN